MSWPKRPKIGSSMQLSKCILHFSPLFLIFLVQVSNNFALPNDPAHLELIELIGAEKAKRNIAVKSVAAAGADVTLSSDWVL